MRDNELLDRAASAIYGPTWHGQLARDLGINARTVQRFATGTLDIPAGVWVKIRKLLIDHATLCQELAIQVHQASASTSRDETSTSKENP